VSGRACRLESFWWRFEALGKHTRRMDAFRYRYQPVKKVATPKKGSPNATGGVHATTIGGGQLLEQGARPDGAMSSLLLRWTAVKINDTFA
jgi:hypothetical protein